MDADQIIHACLNKRIRILTSKGFKYEGYFQSINTESGTITVSDVIILGIGEKVMNKATGRNIVFKGSEIRDLDVVESQDEVDPAIVEDEIDPAIMTESPKAEKEKLIREVSEQINNVIIDDSPENDLNIVLNNKESRRRDMMHNEGGHGHGHRHGGRKAYTGYEGHDGHDSHVDHTGRDSHVDHTGRDSHVDHTGRDIHGDHIGRDGHVDHTRRDGHGGHDRHQGHGGHSGHNRRMRGRNRYNKYRGGGERWEIKTNYDGKICFEDEFDFEANNQRINKRKNDIDTDNKYDPSNFFDTLSTRAPSRRMIRRR